MRSQRSAYLTVAVILALAAGVSVFRIRPSWIGRLLEQSAQHSMPAMPAGGAQAAPPAPPSTAREDVTIDPRRQQLIGVKTVPVTREPLDRTVRAVGAVRYDETKLADINVKVEGWIRDLSVDYTGQPIEKGQRLFTLYSPDLLATQNEYLLALKTRDQLQQSPIPDARQRADELRLDRNRRRRSAQCRRPSPCPLHRTPPLRY